MKFLAILAVAGLAFGLYCYFTSELSVELVRVESAPAAQMRSTFQGLQTAARRGESGVEMFSGGVPDNAEDCFFLTLTYRAQNYGPLPAEWLDFRISPESGDILQVSGAPADVRPLGATEIQVVLLVKNGGDANGRSAVLSYYLLGRKMSVSVP